MVDLTATLTPAQRKANIVRRKLVDRARKYLFDSMLRQTDPCLHPMQRFWDTLTEWAKEEVVDERALAEWARERAGGRRRTSPVVASGE